MFFFLRLGLTCSHTSLEPKAILLHQPWRHGCVSPYLAEDSLQNLDIWGWGRCTRTWRQVRDPPAGLTLLAEAGLEPLTLLPIPPKCWAPRCEHYIPLVFLYLMLSSNGLTLCLVWSYGRASCFHLPGVDILDAHHQPWTNSNSRS